MTRKRFYIAMTLLLVLASGTLGCKPAAAPHTGFISDYSNLESVSDNKARFVSPKLKDYESFIVDPVQWRAEPAEDEAGLKPEEKAEVTVYFRKSFTDVLKANDYTVTDQAGAGVARIRIAITNIQGSTWWANIYPGSKLAGAGTGGAAMEGEVIDSVTGEQLAAVVKSGKGSQLTLNVFSTLEDVENLIDQWAKEAEERLRELRESK